MIRLAVAIILGLTFTGGALGEDVVRYRDRAARGDRPSVVEIKGKVEAESLAGVRIGGRLIPAGDVIDIEYEYPGAIRLDVREARQADIGRNSEDAIRKYRALAQSPTAAANKSLKRFFDYRAAQLVAENSDVSPESLAAAVAALTKFAAEHPDSWQRLHCVRLLAVLQRESNPEAVKKMYEELTTSPIPEIKAESLFAIADLYIDAKNYGVVKSILDAIPPSDPRLPAYRIAASVNPTDPSETIAQLEKLKSAADDAVKPTIYNLIGDLQQLDPKTEFEAKFNYLKVELIFNSNPVETTKAQERLARVFAKMNQDERARMYRDKARGRS